jgi:hypothetical protein
MTWDELDAAAKRVTARKPYIGYVKALNALDDLAQVGASLEKAEAILSGADYYWMNADRVADLAALVREDRQRAALDAAMADHIKLPRRTKKAWRKRVFGQRITPRERGRVARLDRDLTSDRLTRRLVASWFRVPSKLLRARP